jgi:hypothetical protein
MMKNIRNIFGVLGAAALILSCAPLYEPPVAGGGSANTGRVVLTASPGSGAASARTVLPAETPVFSRYTLVFSREGYEPVTIDNAADLAGQGISRELEAGDWTATVTAYRTFTVTGGTPGEYEAARGSLSI